VLRAAFRGGVSHDSSSHVLDRRLAVPAQIVRQGVMRAALAHTRVRTDNASNFSAV
jgi:hypothetical protein